MYEKILFTRLYNFIEKYNILYEFQFGFRQGHSTEHALVEIVDKMKQAIDNNELTCGLFLDLSKAFDTVNHEILLYKLDHYGIRGPALKPIKNYLTNQKQFVKIGKNKSELRLISCGVPTGNIHIFADDTNVFFKCKDSNKITRIGSLLMTQLHQWFKSNKLTLNAEKSNFVVFRSKRKNLTNIPDQLQFENQKIDRKNSVKYLGVTLDEHLTWNEHILDLCNKLKRHFKTFYCIRRYLNKEQVKSIYYALIYSHIKYGITVYGSASKNLIAKIQTLQNKLFKVLLGKN